MDLSDDIITNLEAAALQATTWHEIATFLHRLAVSSEDVLHIIASAFDYSLRAGRGSGRKKLHETFEPMMRLENGEAIPPLLSAVADEWLEIWDAASRQTSQPPVVARMEDLLMERRRGNLATRAKAAVSSYTWVYSQSGWNLMDRVDCLVRSLEIARRFNAPEEAQSVLAIMLRAVEDSVNSAGSEPGFALHLLRALVYDRDCPDAVDFLLSEIRQRVSGAHLVEAVIELQRERSHGNEVINRALDEARVAAWIQEAEGASGFVKVVHYETAARLAGEAGLTSMEEVARSRLQAVPQEDLELSTISAEVSLPEEVVKDFLSPFVDASSVEELLISLLSQPPSTGNPVENRRAVEQSRTEFPLQHLFPRVVLGGDRLPRWKATNDDERDEGELAQQELLRFQIVGRLLARGLWEGGQKFVRLEATQSVVTSFILGLPNGIDEAADLQARALSAFWDSDWTAAVYLALPTVEAVCRRLILSTERGIYQTQRGRRPGQYPGLGILARWLREEGLDEAWYRYIWTLLASPAGLNLRNEVSHGFAFRPGPEHAAAVLHISLYLASLSVEKAEAGEVDSPQ